MPPHPSGPLGGPGSWSAPILVLAKWSLYSGPKPDVADRPSCGLSRLWDLRINEAHAHFDELTVIRPVWQVFTPSNRNYKR